MNATLQQLLTDPLKLALIWSILGLGVFIAYRILDIADLSVEGVLPVAAIASIIIINLNIHPFFGPVLGLAVSLLIGVLCGVITSLLHLYLKIPPLLSGIIMMTALFSVVLVTSNGFIALDVDPSTKDTLPTIFDAATYLFKEWFGPSNVYWANFVGSVLLLIVIDAIIIVALYLFFGTNLGVAIRATGKNKAMAKAQGINTNVMIIIGMAISSGLVGLAGGLLAQMDNQVASTMGKGTIVIGLAIIFLGEVVMAKAKTFKARLISILVGGFIYWLIIDIILSIPNFEAKYLYLTQGILIVLVMSVPYIISLIKHKIDKHKKQKSLKGV